MVGVADFLSRELIDGAVVVNIRARSFTDKPVKETERYSRSRFVRVDGTYVCTVRDDRSWSVPTKHRQRLSTQHPSRGHSRGRAIGWPVTLEERVLYRGEQRVCLPFFSG